MQSIESFYVENRVILTPLSYIVVFVIGLYISRGYPHISIPQMYPNNCRRSELHLNKSRELFPNETLFYHLGMKYGTDKVTFHHYETMYQRHISKYIESNVSVLEIGLGCGMHYGPGASAYLWRDYFGPDADIHFLEYDRGCGEAWYKGHGMKLNVTMHYGSQDDVGFLNTINTARGYFDIIIDDGGHRVTQQITSFTYLLQKVRSGGVYIIEDLQTSYDPNAGGGYLLKGSTIEFIKILVDDVQQESPIKSTPLGQTIFSFEISSRICAFTKK